MWSDSSSETSSTVSMMSDPSSLQYSQLESVPTSSSSSNQDDPTVVLTSKLITSATLISDNLSAVTMSMVLHTSNNIIISNRLGWDGQFRNRTVGTNFHQIFWQMVIEQFLHI